ncbi:hypothetical protein C9J44_17545 [Photobacterium sp. GB-27]|uniref:hypothetical protein n=1 Tax=unclassified Photobacterium TaxID=2628852 RepID=UPI000D15F8A5|nr:MULTISPECIES: hypothetical protein [unclassified Photobacterium]PSV33723.1 hypothetical protein C9J44_17545 [Photobacterium sp. GB-27]PSV57269.1 hypothetical protein C9J43_08835 [Photobacterium sp. GB-3]
MRLPMTSLLIIDPQYDFYDVPVNEQFTLGSASQKITISPALPVPGAWEDANKLAAFITKQQKNINQIIVTLDSHHEYDIAHAPYWKNEAGEHPAPFTLISHQDIVDGIWQPTDPTLLNHVLNYTQSLEQTGKYNLLIWPTHCVIGSVGHDIVKPIQAAIHTWEQQANTQHISIAKGENPHTEHYGGCEAEYPLEDDKKTQFDPQLVELVKQNDQVYISGQALSHCVASTVEQIVEKLTNEEIKKLTILIDTTSPVAGFEQQAKDFMNRMSSIGVNFVTSSNL